MKGCWFPEQVFGPGHLLRTTQLIRSLQAFRSAARIAFEIALCTSVLLRILNAMFEHCSVSSESNAGLLYQENLLNKYMHSATRRP
jgi:hypothetical protein